MCGLQTIEQVDHHDQVPIANDRWFDGSITRSGGVFKDIYEIEIPSDSDQDYS